MPSVTEERVSGLRSIITGLLGLVCVLLALTFYLGHGLINQRSNLTIDIPPDLRRGAQGVRPDEFSAATVYAFASSTLLALHRWETDGQVDFPQNIAELETFMTAEYYDLLVSKMNDMNGAGELRERSRYGILAPGFEMYQPDEEMLVETLGEGLWLATVRIQMVNRQADFEISRRTIEYPIKVRRGNLRPTDTKNAWGLLLDGYPEGEDERLIKDEEINIEVVQ